MLQIDQCTVAADIEIDERLCVRADGNGLIGAGPSSTGELSRLPYMTHTRIPMHTYFPFASSYDHELPHQVSYGSRTLRRPLRFTAEVGTTLTADIVSVAFVCTLPSGYMDNHESLTQSVYALYSFTFSGSFWDLVHSLSRHALLLSLFLAFFVA